MVKGICWCLFLSRTDKIFCIQCICAKIQWKISKIFFTFKLWWSNDSTLSIRDYSIYGFICLHKHGVITLPISQLEILLRISWQENPITKLVPIRDTNSGPLDVQSYMLATRPTIRLKYVKRTWKRESIVEGRMGKWKK